MKTYTINAQTVFSAVKHQWKTFLAIVLAFAVLGAGGGWLFAGRGSAVVGGGGADTLPRVALETVARTPLYFNDCLEKITDSYKKLNGYLGVGSTIDTLPKEQAGPLQERLAALNEEKRQFQQIMLTPLQDALEESGALYIPEEFLDDMAVQYERQLTSIEFQLLAAEAASETVRQIGVPDYPDYYDEKNYDGSSVVINSYVSLIMQAKDYGDLLESRAILEEALRLLRDEPERLLSKSRWAEEAVSKAAEELNTLLDEASQLAREVGKAADVSFSVVLGAKTTYFGNQSYKLITEHTFRSVSLAESFAAIELFCVLVGICVGGFFAICREAKAKKIFAEKPREHSDEDGGA